LLRIHRLLKGVIESPAKKHLSAQKPKICEEPIEEGGRQSKRGGSGKKKMDERVLIQPLPIETGTKTSLPSEKNRVAAWIKTRRDEKDGRKGGELEKSCSQEKVPGL